MDYSAHGWKNIKSPYSRERYKSKRHNMTWENVYIYRIILVFLSFSMLILGVLLDVDSTLIISSLIILLFAISTLGKRVLRGVKI